MLFINLWKHVLLLIAKYNKMWENLSFVTETFCLKRSEQINIAWYKNLALRDEMIERKVQFETSHK